MQTLDKPQIATETLYLDHEGKVTNDPAESRSLLIAEGAPIRADVRAKCEAEGFDLKTAPAEPAAEIETGEKAQTAPPADKSVKTKETK